ncbi:MAG: hypothetical protein HRU19_02945 [Pseudobacteriovorax sp.]|nr:hypothetical protein [Pseudobacteriovorax sp.]
MSNDINLRNYRNQSYPSLIKSPEKIRRQERYLRRRYWAKQKSAKVYWSKKETLLLAGFSF